MAAQSHKFAGTEVAERCKCQREVLARITVDVAGTITVNAPAALQPQTTKMSDRDMSPISCQARAGTR